MYYGIPHSEECHVYGDDEEVKILLYWKEEFDIDKLASAEKYTVEHIGITEAKSPLFGDVLADWRIQD